MKDTLVLAFVLSFIVIISLPVWGDSTNEANTQTNSLGSNTQITEFYSEASKSISNETLTGAKVLKKYPYRTCSGGYTAYVLMGMKKNAYNNAAAKKITSMVNENKEEAMYAEFKKTQAFSRLEAEVAD